MTETKRRKNRGQFRRGPDPRRHKFTQAECIKGFWMAVYSIVQRYPDAIDSAGRHMACDFLRVSGRHNKTEANR